MTFRLVAMPVLLLLGSCTYFSGDSTVLVTSTPQGAEVWVDGQPTGDTTPTRLDLGGFLGSDHTITVQKPGYASESRTVYHYTTSYTSRWIDGAAGLNLPSFPMFWTAGDFVTPFAFRWRYVPDSLDVKLWPEGKAPVGGVETAVQTQ